jgi:hypothetical protein
MIDYKDFIRLTDFYDNTLFKVVNDNAPARSATNAGLIIEKTILERNKGIFSTSNVNFAQFAPATLIGAPNVQHNTGSYYNKLQGNREAFFTGRIPGNEVTYYDDFQANNENPYLATKTFDADDTYAFNRSKYAALLNNITSTETSSLYKKVEYLYPNSTRGINQFITGSTRFQDSYLNSTWYDRSRYSGTKNVDSGSLLPYASSGSVSITSNKISIFNKIKKESFLPNKTILDLRYLSDPSGSLTVLNSLNKNIGDIQNLFKCGDELALGFFKNSSYKNYKRRIFESGYSYRPVLYFQQSGTSDLNETSLNFEYISGYTPDSNTSNFDVRISVPDAKIGTTLSAETKYQIDGNRIYGAFDYRAGDNQSNANGSYTNSDKSLGKLNRFTSPQSSAYNVNVSLGIDTAFSGSGEITYKVNLYKNGSLLASFPKSGTSTPEIDFYYNADTNLYTDAYANKLILDYFQNIVERNALDCDFNNSLSYNRDVNKWDLVASKTLTKVNVFNNDGGVRKTTAYYLEGTDRYTLQIYERNYTFYCQGGYSVRVRKEVILDKTNQTPTPIYVAYKQINESIVVPGLPTNAGSTETEYASSIGRTEFKVHGQYPLDRNDYIEIELFRSVVSGTVSSETLVNSGVSINATAKSDNISLELQPDGKMFLSNSINYMYNRSRFLPQVGTVVSKAKADFGEITEDFFINKNSFVVFKVIESATKTTEYLIRILTAENNIDSRLVLTCSDIPQSLISLVKSGKTYKVCFLSRFLDENALILNYIYTDGGFGDTAGDNPGFIIPWNLNKKVQDSLENTLNSIKNKTNIISSI